MLPVEALVPACPLGPFGDNAVVVLVYATCLENLKISGITQLSGNLENKYERYYGSGRRPLAYLLYYMRTVSQPVHKLVKVQCQVLNR